MMLDNIFLIQIIVTIAFCIVFTIMDFKKGYVPDWINYGLFVFGILSNLILTVITSNIKFILFSVVSCLITHAITFMMWRLNVWGGGDVKLFASIAAVIPFGVNISYLNIYPLLSFYPFSFTVMFNSVLISFPYLLGLLVYLCIKNDSFKKNSDLFIGFIRYDSLKFLIDTNFNRHIDVSDLKEGMMINNYYFDNEEICDLINSNKYTNLKVYRSVEDEFEYYFKTETGGGITKKDMYLLKIMNAQEIISNQISVKVTFPFVPLILAGLIVAVFYGDLSMLILKNVVFVI